MAPHKQLSFAEEVGVWLAIERCSNVRSVRLFWVLYV